MANRKLDLNPAFVEVLRKLDRELSPTDINWVVTGSVGFALQGVPVVPNDIDLQSDEAGVYEIERRLAEFVVRSVTFSATERIRSHFGALRIGGIKVEIMGDIQKRLEDGRWEEPVDLRRHKRVVEMVGMQLPVLSLAYEYTAYLRLGRKDRAAMLKNWLDEKEEVDD